MNSLVYGKKLLLLGANAESISIVEVAKKMGVFVVVTDNILHSPAKKVANKYFDVDGKDIEKLNKIINDEDIDGVLVGSADPLVSSYCALCKSKAFPCYITEEHKDFFTNKQEFKKWLRVENIPVIKEYYSGGLLEEAKDIDFQFPLIIKPEVGRGGKGVFLCREREELKFGFEMARSCSDNKRVIIEEYLECDEVTVNYVFSNGTPKLMILSDRLSLKAKGEISPVTYGNLYPSVHTEMFIKEYHDKFCNLFKKMNIKHGILEMQMFIKDGKFYPYDPACILGGELSGKVFSEVLGAKLIENLIIYALTGKMPEYEVNAREGYLPNNKYAASVWLLLMPGTIDKICGMEKVKTYANVLGYVSRLKEGDIVTEEMYQTEKSTLARLWISADSKEKLIGVINDIRSEVKVYDKNGNNMLYQI